MDPKQLALLASVEMELMLLGIQVQDGGADVGGDGPKQGAEVSEHREDQQAGSPRTRRASGDEPKDRGSDEGKEHESD
jgi:hypothetical protein